MESVDLNKTDRREAIKIIGGLIVVGAGMAPLSALARQPRGAAVKDLHVAPAAPGNGPRPGAPLPAPPRVKLNRLPGATQEAMVARLLGPVKPGATLGAATVEGVYGVRLGAASVTMKLRTGETCQVDICRRDTSATALEPVASTRRYDLFLANGARGRLHTGQAMARLVVELARIIRSNETSVPRLSLLPLRERLRRYPRGRFDASL